MINFNKTCLIITGTINPDKNVYSLKLTDSNERLRQYIDSINFYINNTNIKNIVFCDNSNFFSKEITDLVTYAKNKGKIFEYLSFKGDSFKTLEKGKGYGEGEIIKYIFDNSSIINNTDLIIKVTGRLKISNINMLLKLCKNNFNYFDTTKRYRCETRFYIIRTDLYKKYFMNSYLNVDDKNNIWLEHIFQNIILEKNIKYRLFPIMPIVVGMSGSTGKLYTDSKIKYYAKLILSKFKIYQLK